MKIVSSEDKITVFIYKKENIKDINEYMKKLILKLKRKYQIDIFGFYSVKVYKNKKIGMIIELIKEDDIDFFTDLVDLKIKVYENSDIFLKFNDYFLKEKKSFYTLDNNYYIDINKITNKEFLSMIEFCNIIYGENLLKIKDQLLIHKTN